MLYPNARPRLLVLAATAGLFGWIFADALFGSGMFAFRDAAHYYYPLFKFVQGEWAAGRVPLWNPHENLGVPLAANATASVFYPGKLIFAVGLDYGWAYKIYVMAHVLLAAATAYRLARHFGASVPAAGCCALSYAFSGNVLMQYANVVFLVGAAWLPLALLAADRMLVGRTLGWSFALAAVLAMMVLGGDPQMAYNAGLLAAAQAVWLWWSASPLSLFKRVGSPLEKGATAGLSSSVNHRLCRSTAGQASSGTRHRLSLLALAAGVALALSAVQVLPSMEFAALSDRAASETARSLYEVPGCLGEADSSARIADGLLCRRPDKATHHEHVYHFSVGPWRLAEYLWPNFAGRQFPEHQRWLEVIPAEGRIWTPSLYMGVLPLVLALSVLQFRRKEPNASCRFPVRFLSWLTLAAVLASFGWFGIGWLVHEISIAAGADPHGPWAVGSPVGGLYWLMTVLLPGYIQFRYPAKLLVVAALTLSLLSARGWDAAFSESPNRTRRILLWLGVISLAAAVVTVLIRPIWIGWMATVGPDMLFGPFDASGAAVGLVLSFLQTAVVCLICLVLFRKFSPLPLGEGPGVRGARALAPALALAIVALDLALANGWLVACAPADLWTAPSKLTTSIRREEAGSDGGRPVRVCRNPIWMPPAWKTTSSPDRLAEAVRWDRDTLWPKYNLAQGVAITEVHGTMMLEDFRTLLAETDKALLPGKLGAKYLILPAGRKPPNARLIDDSPQDARLWKIEPADQTDPCRIVHYDPTSVTVEARLSEPGLIVLADQFYPGWRVEVQTEGGLARSLPIERTDNCMRGVRLAAGNHRLVFRYRPGAFYSGALVSVIAWLALLVAATFCRLRSRPVD